HNIGRNQSRKARQNIEQDFGLVRAEHQKEINKLTPQNVQKIQYGKSETKRAIANVLDAVLPHYKYASLTELNAVLKQYNVLADRGGEKSKMYKHNGLVYRILNEQGKKVGAPIKASLFSNKPTLAFLEEKFIQNYQFKQRHQSRVKNTVEFSFLKNPEQTLQTLQQELQKEQISLVIKQNKAAFIHERTYVDHKAKCVFTGSDLGKQYSANAI
ncbi:MAG: relaxase, partial [Bacteroidota bacterium]|nr:relaxase [Bacteroidota bacterium]